MNRLFLGACLILAVCVAISGVVYADPSDPGAPHDVSVGIPINTSITGRATMTVIPKNITDDVEHAVSFAAPTTPWTVSEQYLDVVYDCNYATWGIRIISNNVAAFPGIYGKPTAALTDADGDGDPWDGPPEHDPATPSDDAVSYGGLINDATKTNPENRAELVWQVFADKADGPDALNNDSVKGRNPDGTVNDTYNWNAPWAYVTDIDDTVPVDTTGDGTADTAEVVNISIDPDGDYDTISYHVVAQGSGTANGLNYHPATYVSGELQPKPGDGQIAVFVGAKLSEISAGDFGTQIYVQLVHE